MQHYSAHDLIWIAGFLEGEGSFFLSRPTRRQFPTPMITWASTDEDIARRMASYLNVSAWKEPGKIKPLFRCRAAGKQAAALMLLILPYMGIRRGEKILSILRWYIGKLL